MVNQQAVTTGVFVEATLLDVLQHDVVTVIVRIDYLVAFAIFFQGSEIGYLTGIRHGLNGAPSHDLLFPGRIEAGGKAVVVVAAVVHDVP